MWSGATAAYQIASAVLAAANTQLTYSVGGTPHRVCVVPGAIAWDECECGDGQLAIASTRTFMADSFPAQAIKPQWNNLAGYIDNEFVIQIIRCVPTIADDGAPPTPASLDKSAQIVMADAYEVMCSTAATLQGLVDTGAIDDYVIYDQVFVGPEGACGGSELRFATQVLR